MDRAEELVCLLPRVSGCRIRFDEAGAPLAVMVTAIPGSNPRAVAADVITVLAAQARMDVLEEQIHVVTLDPGSADAPELVAEEVEDESRLQLVAYQTHVAQERTIAEIELACGDQIVLGHAESRGAGASPELLGQACLDAIEKLCHGRVTLRMLSFQRVQAGDRELALVVVQESMGRTELVHVGAAAVSAEVGRAAAYAALDAMNRRLGRILTDPPSDYEVR
jgi:hypothetical protein